MPEPSLRRPGDPLATSADDHGGPSPASAPPLPAAGSGTEAASHVPEAGAPASAAGCTVGLGGAAGAPAVPEGAPTLAAGTPRGQAEHAVCRQDHPPVLLVLIPLQEVHQDRGDTSFVGGHDLLHQDAVDQFA